MWNKTKQKQKNKTKKQNKKKQSTVGMNQYMYLSNPSITDRMRNKVNFKQSTADFDLNPEFSFF